MKGQASMAGAGKEDRTGPGDAVVRPRDTVAEHVAALIRKRSAAGELIAAAEIPDLWEDEYLSFPNADGSGEDIAGILTRLVHENEDLHKLSGAGSPFYYSDLHMTAAYAQIVLHKQEGPLRLIAETVRQNSWEYQRPIALDIFTQPPFNLEYSQVREYLSIMTAMAGYGDIVATSSSASRIYLYSTAHLEREHAVMLAEWLDVGQAHNP